MALKLVVPSTEGLSAEVAALYSKQDDGTFRLGVDDVPDVTNLQKALKSEREMRETAQREAKRLEKQFEGLDVEELRGLAKQLEGSEEAKLFKEGKLDQVVAKRMERREAEIAKIVKKAEEEKAAAVARSKRQDQRIADGIARDAAIKAGIHQHAVDDFVLAVRYEGWTLNDDDELVLLDKDGSPVLGKDGKTRLTIQETAESKRDTRPHWFPASASGSGAKPGFGGPGAKVMKRAQFDQLPAKQRAAFMSGGGSIQD